MRTTVTLAVSKSVGAVSRWLGRGGGQALPGLVADRIDKNLTSKLAPNLAHGIILVTGTNGKTTSTKLIASVLEAAGEKVLTNSTGSNLKRGITAALLRAASISGKFDETIGLFEVDEANLRLIAPLVRPKLIVVLNLFRDQLDRYGELDTTAALIGAGIASTEADLVLNADDPLVASLAKYANPDTKVSYFGLGRVAKAAQGKLAIPVDSDRCPVCHARLEFDEVFYGHLGHWRCPNGDAARPEPTVVAYEIKNMSLDGVEFVLRDRHRGKTQVKLPLPGLYNIYNAVAAAAAGSALGVPLEVAVSSVDKAEAAFGRVERVSLGGRTIYLLLIKNPAGFGQVLEIILSQASPHLLMAINDLDADGRDVSWLWDVPLDELSKTEPKVTATGIRAADMALRLKYADIDAVAEESVERAIMTALTAVPEGGNLFVLPTYTAMLQIRKLLSKKSQIEDVWK